MPQVKRTELKELLADDTILSNRVFLFFGERYLCREAADAVQEKLLANGGNVHAIDGDQEEPGQTLARLMSFSLFPGRQLYRVTDTKIFHSKTVAEELWVKALQAQNNDKQAAATRHLLSMAQTAGLSIDSQKPLGELAAKEWQKLFGFTKPAESLDWADNLLFAARGNLKSGAADLAEKYIAAFDKGLPAQNSLILTAETVDKRQRLFTYLKKNGVVVDCTVATGAGSAAQTEQKDVIRELMRKTLAEFGKQIEPQAVELFFTRVGFHPVAVVMESEKLAHYVGDRPQITSDDLEAMVGHNREDALFELTDAFAKRQISRTLAILTRLREHGVHELAILSTMRNYIRKQLIFRSLQMQPAPAWRRGMNAREFQNNYLPALKAEGRWDEFLQGHPYALFMSFSKAADYSIPGLKRWFGLLLDAEYRLKGSPLPAGLILEELFLTMLKGSGGVNRATHSVIY